MQLSITQDCCVNCDLGDPTEAGEPGCKGQAATQVEWKGGRDGGGGVRGQLSSMSGLLIRKCCLSLQGVHRVCRVLDTYSQSDINLPAAESEEKGSGTARGWGGVGANYSDMTSEDKTNSHFSS